MSTIICKNCDAHFKGKFCSNCGQAFNVKKINASYLLHDIPHSIFHIDKGFFYTLWHLLINPGKTLKEYLEGKRVKHFKPFAFVVLLSTICTILVKVMDKLINLKYAKEHPGYIIDSTYQNYFAKYPTLIIFALIPILSLITWIFFKKEKYNYWEHFLVNTYLAAYLNIFFLLLNIYRSAKYFITDTTSVGYIMFVILFMSYYSYAFDMLMPFRNRTLSFIIKMVLFIGTITLVYITAFSLSGMMTPWWS